jgi:hypothetical protein
MVGFERVKSCAADGGEMERCLAEERSSGSVQESFGMITCMITVMQYISISDHSNACGLLFE